ncbi:MAG: sensor histidine kinase, partial [Nitrospirota bacterium]
MKSISTKLILLLIISLLIPLSIYGALSIWTSRHFNFKSVTEGNINVAKRAAGEINLYVTNNIAILNALAQNMGRFNIPEHEQRLMLSNYILNFPGLEKILITNETGKEVMSTDGNLSIDRSQDIAYQTAMKGEVYKSDVFISENLTPSMTIAVPLKRLDTIIGAMIADINLVAMWNLVDSIRIGEKGYAFVVTGEGKLIAHGLGNGKVRVLRNEMVRVLSIVREVQRGKDIVDIYRNIDGDKVIGVAVPIPSLGWAIVIEEPLTEAYASTRQMTLFLIILIVMFAVFASILGYRSGRRYIIQPIQTLIAATRRIAGGDLDNTVIIKTGDEFQEVGDSFNKMTAQLKIFREEIRRNERIAFMNKIAAGLVHDLRHPVRNIENCSRLILKMHYREEDRQSFNTIIERELGNINHFLDDLLNLSRPVKLTPVTLDICNEISSIADMFCEEAANKGIIINKCFTDESVKVKADKFSIERVVKNI